MLPDPEVEARYTPEELLDGVLRSALDGVMVFRTVRDASGAILDFEWVLVNETDRAPTDRPPSFYIGRRLLEVYPQTRGIGAFDRYAQVVETGVPSHFDVEFVPGRWREVSVVKLGDGFVVSYREITERRRSEERLQRSRQELTRAQALARAGSWSFDLATGEATVSRELLDIFGLPLDAPAADYSFWPHIDPGDADRVRASWVALTGGGASQAQRIEYRIRRADTGEVRVVFAITEVIRGDSGRPERLFGSIQDITDRVRAEEERVRLEHQLAEAQRAESLGLLAGGIAHDFNNLLMVVLANAAEAVKAVPERSLIQGMLQDIETAARRMADLARQMLAYAGRGRFSIEAVDPDQLVEETAQLLRRSIGRDAVLSSSLRGGATVEVDPAQLRQVAMNLLLNASDALESKPGAIHIRSHLRHISEEELAPLAPGLPARLYWVLEVKDDGIGMDAATQRRMFDPFFTTKSKGRGLGLSAVQGIVRRFKGAITVESAPGEGTTLRIFLPAVAATPIAPAAPEPVRIARRLRVLLADDEEVVAVTLQQMLLREGFEVTWARDGRLAWELFQRDPQGYDVALLDVIMPHIQGTELVGLLLSVCPSLKTILMSGCSEGDALGDPAVRRPDVFLEKPFTRAELSRALAAALSRA
ncbi:MAG: response regulator [Polyangiaceae bacterium]|nr:response regulator [Polyangiaceae bacterium]